MEQIHSESLFIYFRGSQCFSLLDEKIETGVPNVKHWRYIAKK